MLRGIAVGDSKAFVVARARIARLEPKEVRLRPLVVGICGSDLHDFHAPASTHPVIRGHEFVAVVVEKGKDVDDFELGARVVVEPLLSCGKCELCQSGRPALCEGEMRIVGVFCDGGMAEEIVLPAAVCHAVPSTLTDEVAVLTEPIAVVLHAFRKLKILVPEIIEIITSNSFGSPSSLDGIWGSKKLLVLGGGSLGALSLLVAKLNGFQKVHMTARYDFQRQMCSTLAKEINLELVFHSDEEVKALKPDIVIETVGGAANTFHLAVEASRSGALIILLGIFDSKAEPPSAFDLVVKELVVAGSNCYDHVKPNGQEKDIVEALAVLERYGAALVRSKFLSHVVPFENASLAFEMATQKEKYSSTKVAVRISSL